MKVTAVFLLVISLMISNSFSLSVSRGTLRLVRYEQPSLTQAWSSGIVQVYYNNNWGNICNDTSFGRTEADVICHQLSYTGASTYTNTGITSSFGTDNSTTLLEDVSCSSSDLLVLLQCSVTEQYSASCSSSTQNDVIVQCYTDRIWDNPFPGQIRLVGGTYSNTGLLQVYCNGQWGTVCDDYYDSNAARVSCNQLGYNYYTNYDHLSIQGTGNVPIWAQQLYCSSSSLLCVGYCGQCPSSPISGCTHSEDVTLDCAYSSLLLPSIVTDRTCESIVDTTGPGSVGAMRLLNNGSTSLYNTAGRVQVWYGGQWGNICSHYSFWYDEADVICHQLGWSGASGYSNAEYDNFDDDNLPTVINYLDCNTYSSSEYLTIFQCSYSTTISSSCTSNNDVSVTCYTTRIWDSAYTGQIRLSRGQYSNQGLLEVYCNGQWGTVCDHSFGSNEATVACKQLGYSSYDSYGSLSITGNSTQPIWFDNVHCSTSSLKCLANCIKCPSSDVHNCVHSKDITLECTYSSFQLPSIVTDRTCEIIADTKGPGSVGAMRLLNNGSTSLYNTAGRVQVWYGGQWGNICSNYSFGYDEADVICHQLGWSGASGYSNAEYDNFDDDNLPTVINYLDCNKYSSSEYLTIFQCSYSTTISSSCTSNNDVSVTCYTTRIWDSAYTGQIRLSRGQYSNQGLLEVYCNGQWGTVCDHSFGSNEATVACKQLGYSSYDSYGSLSITGNSTQPIWFDNVHCSTSSLKCLANCIKCPSSDVHNCVHSKDITLECSGADSSTYSSIASTCKGVDHGPNSSDTIAVLVGGIVGSIFFIIFIAVGIIVCIVIFRKYRARSTRQYSRFQPQPVTTETVVTQSADIPSLQVPLSSMNPMAPSPDQQNLPYNPQNTADYSIVY